VWIDSPHCTEGVARLVVEHSAGLLQLDAQGRPILGVSEEEAADKDSELIALEIECRRSGHPVVFVDLPIAGLDH
jgi:hypothetical protein